MRDLRYRRAYGEAAAPMEERATRRLARLLTEKRWQSFTPRDVQRCEREGLRSSADIAPALDMLTQGGWIRMQARATGAKGGRPRVVYRVNPALDGAA